MVSLSNHDVENTDYSSPFDKCSTVLTPRLRVTIRLRVTGRWVTVFALFDFHLGKFYILVVFS